MYWITHNQQMTEQEIAQLFITAKRRGAAEAVFYEGGVTTWQEWLEYLRSEMAWVLRCVCPIKGLIGFAWLTNFEGKSAQIHFCSWAISLCEFEAAAEQMLLWLYDVGGLWALTAINPHMYRHTAKAATRVGFREVGYFPHYCYLQRRDMYVAARIMSINLKEKYDGKRCEEAENCRAVCA